MRLHGSTTNRVISAQFTKRICPSFRANAALNRKKPTSRDAAHCAGGLRRPDFGHRLLVHCQNLPKVFRVFRVLRHKAAANRKKPTSRDVLFCGLSAGVLGSSNRSELRPCHSPKVWDTFAKTVLLDLHNGQQSHDQTSKLTSLSAHEVPAKISARSDQDSGSRF